MNEKYEHALHIIMHWCIGAMVLWCSKVGKDISCIITWTCIWMKHDLQSEHDECGEDHVWVPIFVMIWCYWLYDDMMCFLCVDMMTCLWSCHLRLIWCDAYNDNMRCHVCYAMIDEC